MMKTIKWLLFKVLKKIHKCIPKIIREKYRIQYRRIFFERVFQNQEEFEYPLPSPNQLNAWVGKMESLPIEISLITNFECVYHCTYCFAYKPKKSEYRKHSSKKWEEALYSLYKKYGQCRLVLSGGEPLFYNDAVDFVIHMTKYHHVTLGTNLFIKMDLVEKIARESKKENLYVTPAFHLEHASIDEFIDKVLVFKEHGVNLYVAVVAYPKYLTKMEKIKDKFEAHALQIGFFPYIGMYESRTFPDEYSEKELEIMRGLPGWHESAKDSTKIQLPRTKGMLCYAGIKTITINPEGYVSRCIHVDQIMGNIFDPKFSFLKKPMPCPVEVCNCELYWKYHLKEGKRYLKNYYK